MDTSTRNALIVSLYAEGLYPIAIRAKTGVSLSQIYRVLHSANMTLRSQAESHRHHQMDFAFFERIDSHEKAQVLGFIAADGCVTDKTIAIAIAQCDHAHLEWIKRVINYTGDVRVYPSRRPNEQACSSLILCSPKMVGDITRLGCGPRKSLTLQFPTEEQVPRKFLLSYMLGYFEGDGSLSPVRDAHRPSPDYVFTIAGTEPFCRRYAQELGIAPNVGIVPPRPDNKISVLRLGGNRQVKRVMDLLYSHMTYTLTRKRNHYHNLVAQLQHLDEHGWTVPSRRKAVAA